MVEPIFEDDSNKEIEEKVKKLVDQKLAEKDDIDKKKSISEKIQLMKETAMKEKEEKKKDKEEEKKKEPEKPHVHEVVDVECPTCKGHNLKVQNKVAKCEGPNCGKEFLLVEKIKKSDDLKNKRKGYICTSCGHTITDDEVKDKSIETCPLCNLGVKFLPIDWNSLEKKTKALTK